MQTALEAGRQALLLRPGCANAIGFFGNVLHYCGEQREAIAHIRRGIRLQPVFPPFFASILSAACFLAGNEQSALVIAKEALRLNARDLQSRLVLVAGSQLAGNPELARMFAAEVAALEPTFSVASYCDDQPYRDPQIVAALAAACRAAGLPA